MADQDALRDLQTRLAERMAKVRAEAPVQSWLAVRCGGLGVLLPLKQSGEIFKLGPVLPVPHAQPWFLGVINHRGSIFTVIDFSRFLGLRSPGDAHAAPDQARLVALNAGLGINCALLVDGLEGLRREGDLLPDDSDDNEPRPAFASARWRDSAGRRWQEINLAELALQPQFLAVAG